MEKPLVQNGTKWNLEGKIMAILWAHIQKVGFKLPESRRDQWRMEELSWSTPSPVDICRFPIYFKTTNNSHTFGDPPAGTVWCGSLNLLPRSYCFQDRWLDGLISQDFPSTTIFMIFIIIISDSHEQQSNIFLFLSLSTYVTKLKYPLSNHLSFFPFFFFFHLFQIVAKR